jgi:transcriptional regulator with XRE-family HTH domain
MDIKNHIKELMEERGWTSYQLAKQSGLSHSTITNIFKRNNAPTIPTLEAVCQAFGITLSQFFSEGNTPAELTEEQRTLFAAWSTLNDDQKEALLLLIKRI